MIRAREFVEILPRHGGLVVSCRTTDFETLRRKLPVKGRVSLRSLSDEQIRDYLSTQPVLLAAIQNDDELKEMLRTPLLVALFAFAYRDMAENDAASAVDFARSPADVRDRIIAQYVKRCLEWEARKRDMPIGFDDFVAFCCKIAFDDAARLGEEI